MEVYIILNIYYATSFSEVFEYLEAPAPVASVNCYFKNSDDPVIFGKAIESGHISSTTYWYTTVTKPDVTCLLDVYKESFLLINEI